MKRVLMLLFLFGLISFDRASKECLEDNPEECESKEESLDIKDIKDAVLRLREMENKLLTAYIKKMENSCKDIRVSDLTATEDDVSNATNVSSTLECPLPPPGAECTCPLAEKGDRGVPGSPGYRGPPGVPGWKGESSYQLVQDFPFIKGEKGDKGETSMPCKC